MSSLLGRAVGPVLVVTVVACGAFSGSDNTVADPGPALDAAGVDGGDEMLPPVGGQPPPPPPPGCDATKSPAESPACVADSYGIFVSASGNDSALGTQAAPLATIAAGIERAAMANRPRVYVCGGTYAGSAEIKAGVEIFGGLSCASAWKPDTLKVEWSASKPEYVARISDVLARVRLEGVELVAVAATVPGTSSAALIASGSLDVVLERVKLTASAGMTGDSRVALAGDAPAIFGGSGNLGGVGGTQTCSDGASIGGKGGSNGGGDTGSPSLGAGAGGTAGGDCALTGAGNGGNPSAAAGDAPALTVLGVLSAGGWTPASGDKGLTAGRAQGGGGGASHNDMFPVVARIGGGGGAGGCGGAGGLGGGGGGASIAVASYQSKLTINNSELHSGAAGAGGNGAAGQPGQPGGMGGFGDQGGSKGCMGGAGGHAGSGGGGAGGAGGLSAAIAYVGTAPMLTSTMSIPGTLGAAGAGGGAANAGPIGEATALKALQ
jgi:hypothetical protein